MKSEYPIAKRKNLSAKNLAIILQKLGINKPDSQSVSEKTIELLHKIIDGKLAELELNKLFSKENTLTNQKQNEKNS